MVNSQIYLNGKLYIDREKFHEAMLIQDGRIICTGKNSEILSKAPKASIQDLKGKTVLPGFIDSHLHFLMTAEYVSMLPISEVKSMEELIEKGRTFLEEQDLKQGDILYTEGWNQEQFTDSKRMPDKTDLDRISTTIPVLMGRVDRHVISLNSAALEMTGITAAVSSPEGGEIVKDKNGQPTGILKERAIDLIWRSMPSKSKALQQRLIKRTMQLANQQGLTSVHTCDSKDEDVFETYKIYEELAQKNELTLRFYHQMWFNDGTYLKSYLNSGWKTGQGSFWNRVGPVKLFADGALGGRTAAMRQEYADDPGNKGILTKSQETLNEEVMIAVENDHQVIVHAIGDKGIEAVLDAYDQVTEDDENELRLGINHVQITDRPLLERIRNRNYLTYVQPVFLDDDIPIVEKRAGKQLASTSYAFGTMHQMGIRQSFGTDSPIASFDPFKTIYCAITRKRLDGTPKMGFIPEEAVDIFTAVDAYTIESAYASFEEHQKGRLKEGYLADFIVLDRDIFSITPEEIKDTRVLLTVVDGKKVYQDNEW